MKILQCKQEAIFDIGFIDPNTIYEQVVKQFPIDTEDALLGFLVAQNTKLNILFPYNFK
jgi:hypothetical protein